MSGAVVGVGLVQHPDDGTLFVAKDGAFWKRVNVGHPERRQWLLRKLETDRDGYFRIRIAGKNRIAHREVYRAFFGEIECGLVVCHRNGDRRDNRPENLLAATQRENISHKILHGTAQLGEKHGMASASDEAARKALAAIANAKRSRSGRLLRGEAARIAETLGISRNFIYGLSRQRKAWSHV